MRFPRPCLSKRIDLNLTNKIRQLPWNTLNETLILLKFCIFSFEVKFYSTVNIIELGQEYFKYLTLNNSLIWSCMAYWFLVPLYLVLISRKFFITCSKSTILVYFLFMFAYLILSTLFCLICSFFHLSTTSEAHSDPIRMSEVAFLQKCFCLKSVIWLFYCVFFLLLFHTTGFEYAVLPR